MRAPSDTPVLILTGPPGVGKTTAAALLAERHERSAHLESDAFFSFIRSGFVAPWTPESHDQNRLVMEIVAAAAAGYAAGGYLTIVDGIVIPRWFLAPLRDDLRAAGHEVAYAVLRAPLEVCAARVDAREGPGVADLDAIAGIWDQFTALGEFERNAIEVRGSAEDVAAEVERRLHAGQLAI